MLPVYSPESHFLYQDFLISNFLLYYPDPFSISRQTKEILEEILHNDEETKDDKGMVRFVDELGENAVIMGLRVWVATDKYWSIKWRLNQLIKEAFDANGIEIPYNQVHVKEESRI